ncbi:plasminogen-like [Gigantopelta aegis]|uniref:plasminogen-like n=1 Tax=Gigantopelta aegis TaxID=1735272 RepID=UPI001B88B208|nr:plasminogen-like [Gigantopelta aegis]
MLGVKETRMDTYNLQWRILGMVIFLWTEANAQCMTLLAHSQSVGGRRMPGIDSLVDCAEHCLSDLLCHSVDFNKQDSSCWIHDRWRPVRRANCPCHHLEKVLQCKQAAPECYSIVNKKTIYYGTKRTTASGISCQRWDKQTPHKHSKNNATDFPDASLAAVENFCRDPDGEGYPWCYTEDPRIRWSSCGVPSCTGPFRMKLVTDAIGQTTTVQHVSTPSTSPATIQTKHEMNFDDGEKVHASCNNSRAFPETGTVVIGCIASVAFVISATLLIMRFRSCKNCEEYLPHLKRRSKDNSENVNMSCYSVFK